MIHKHKWDAFDVEKINWSDPRTGTITRRATRVLHKCRRCRRVSVDEIAGHWTLEQVLGLPPKGTA